MTKQQKADMINAAIERSSVAVEMGCKAVILDDGRLEYQMLSRNGRYTMRATLREVLVKLHGDDIRAIQKAMGK